MRVLFLADADFAYREHAMLRRLQIGLLDEGIVALHAQALSTPPIEFVDAPHDGLTFQDAGPSITLQLRARALIRQLEERADAPAAKERLVDVVHAFGVEAWAMARTLAFLTGAALTCELHAASLVHRVRRAELLAHRAMGPALSMAWSCPDPSLIEAVERVSTRAKVRHVPWGVHIPASPPPARASGAPLALAVVADAQSPERPHDLLEALSAFDPDARAAPPDARRHADQHATLIASGAADTIPADADEPWMHIPPRPLVFVDEHAAAWLNRAGKLDLLGLRERITLVPSLEAHRDLALRADALILPQASGVHRTLTLDAMALGLRVIAAPDRWVSTLDDAQTAVLARPSGNAGTPESAAWAAALEAAFPEATGPNPLIESTRAILRGEHLASRQIADLINLYNEVAGPPPVAFISGNPAESDTNT